MLLKLSCCGLATVFLSLVGCKTDRKETLQAPDFGIEPQMSSEATEVAAGDLRGTMLSAGPSAPTVLIVPGSGPTDRNGNSPQGIKAQPYKLLAEGLAINGISSVRVDKRGMFASHAAGDPNAVTVEQYAEDYRAWIKSIRTSTGLECIWLLGHSEGGLMVMAAAVDQTDVCGLIIISAVGRRFGDVLREQLKANPSNAALLKDAFHFIAELEEGNKVDVSNSHPALQSLFNPAVQGFLISLFTTDPAALARRIELPTLVIQGSHDIQVSVDDAQILATASKGKLIVLEGVNHVLKKAPKNRFGNIATYSVPGIPLAEGIVSSIEQFIEDQN